jgi:Tfp pilus assembly protein PilO
MTKMRQWTLMTAIAVLVVLAGGWLLLVKPQRSNISSVKSQASTQLQANQVLQQEIAARQALKSTLASEQAKLQKLSVQVPAVPDEPGVIRQAQSSASGAGVNLLSITPGPVSTVSTSAATGTTLGATAGATLMQLPVTLTVIGTYANMESYFQLLDKLPRAVLITGFTLCPVDNGGTSGCSAPTPPAGTVIPSGGLGATITAEVFYSPVAAASPTTTTTLPGATTPSTAATPAATTATTPASPAATTTPAPTASAAN